MKKIAIAIACMGLGASAAMAADLPVKAAPVAPAAVYNWTGFYAGLNVGYDWGRVDWTYFNNPSQTSSRHPEGWSVGGHLGAQYQFQQFLVGVEGSWSGSFKNIDDRGRDSPQFAATFDTIARIVNVWTAGGRVGWIFSPQWMVFASGGYAESQIDGQFFQRSNPIVRDFRSATHNGWYAGGGVEYLFTNYAYVGIEYRHVELNTVLVGPNIPVTNVSRYVDPSFDLVQLRLGFKITPGQTAVVAKY